MNTSRCTLLLPMLRWPLGFKPHVGTILMNFDVAYEINTQLLSSF